jgi:hypothetical protein
MVKNVKLGYHAVIPNYIVNVYYTRDTNNHDMRIIRCGHKGTDKTHWRLCDLTGDNVWMNDIEYDQPEHAMNDYP